MKNFLQAKICFLILTIAVCAVASQAQRKPAPKKPAAAAKTAEGVLYFVGHGNQITQCVVQTDAGAIEFDATNKTRYIGFKTKFQPEFQIPAWNLGAKWRVVYRNTPYGMWADSITYLGEVKAIADAEELGRSFLHSIADADFKTAYSRLSPKAKQTTSLNALIKIYKDVEVTFRSVIICSQTNDAVQILLAPHGADGGDLYQPAEVVQIGGKSFINSLGAFRETYAGCGGLK